MRKRSLIEASVQPLLALLSCHWGAVGGYLVPGLLCYGPGARSATCSLLPPPHHEGQGMHPTSAAGEGTDQRCWPSRAWARSPWGGLSSCERAWPGLSPCPAPGATAPCGCSAPAALPEPALPVDLHSSSLGTSGSWAAPSGGFSGCHPCLSHPSACGWVSSSGGVGTRECPARWGGSRPADSPSGARQGAQAQRSGGSVAFVGRHRALTPAWVLAKEPSGRPAWRGKLEPARRVGERLLLLTHRHSAGQGRPARISASRKHFPNSFQTPQPRAWMHLAAPGRGWGQWGGCGHCLHGWWRSALGGPLPTSPCPSPPAWPPGWRPRARRSPLVLQGHAAGAHPIPCVVPGPEDLTVALSWVGRCCWSPELSCPLYRQGVLGLSLGSSGGLDPTSVLCPRQPLPWRAVE